MSPFEVSKFQNLASPVGICTRAGKTILIVEDDELNVRLFNDLLQAHGYCPLQINDGREAIALMSEHKPYLILMDINLSKVSGLEIIRKIKRDETLEHMPVIAITTFAMS